MFILLEASEMYLARVNTGRLRANGNITGAEYLLRLQKEWRKALHDYQNEGIAVKSKSLDQKKVLKELFNARKLATKPAEKEALSKMIEHQMADLGYPLTPDPQGELPV